MNEGRSAVRQPPSARPASGDAEQTDRRLLEEFLNDRNEAAFEALVKRHGPMVYGVCLRVLHDAHAAEDAFQATFLVLLRKSPTLKAPRLLANWLYGVAYRVASKAKLKLSRRESREHSQADLTSVAAPLGREDLEWEEIRSIMDEEISRLPEKHRGPLVLCDLEGRTHAEAARELGCPAGSMSWRLEKARETFRQRLRRRGVKLSGALLAALLSQEAAPAAVPTGLLQTTIEAARLADAGQPAVSQGLSDQVLELAEAVIKENAAPAWGVAGIAVAILLSALAALGLSTAVLTADERDRSGPEPLKECLPAEPAESVGGCALADAPDETAQRPGDQADVDPAPCTEVDPDSSSPSN